MSDRAKYGPPPEFIVGQCDPAVFLSVGILYEAVADLYERMGWAASPAFRQTLNTFRAEIGRRFVIGVPLRAPPPALPPGIDFPLLVQSLPGTAAVLAAAVEQIRLTAAAAGVPLTEQFAEAAHDNPLRGKDGAR